MKTLLGDQTPGRFLRRFWQKEARLIRGALPGFTGIFTREQLFALAGRDDVESRLVLRNRGRWTLDQS
jgi:50S ribosomal protein L16 3-hydroxylase